VNKAKPKMQIHVREACEADKEAVFEFCRHTWSWGDYIPDVWDKWLKEENGKVYVATINDVPIGIQHITIDKLGEAWLSGARTARVAGKLHPNMLHRRRTRGNFRRDEVLPLSILPNKGHKENLRLHMQPPSITKTLKKLKFEN